MQALFYKLQKIIIYCVLPDFFLHIFWGILFVIFLAKE